MPRLRMSSLFLVAALVLGIAGVSRTAAENDDKIDGALWRFEMKPAKPGLEPLTGKFRVKGKFVYQRTTRESKTLDKVVGEKTATNGKVTNLKIVDLRAKTKDRAWLEGIQGKMVLKADEIGKWSGRFVDSEGQNWEVQCERFQE